MDNEQNDYDRISGYIERIVSIVWAASIVVERDNDVATNLIAPSLDTATRKLNELNEWVRGLALTHHQYDEEVIELMKGDKDG